ncbi:GlxA family transcriptional regulator, partial [Rhizobium leguminosarum]|nr:GlxA family transcriptional regulator [Rhizobium leguminosarum]
MFLFSLVLSALRDRMDGDALQFRKQSIHYRNLREATLLQRSTDRLDIDLLVLPDANLILIASVIEPLRGANRISGSELYRWRLLTPDGAPVLTTSNIAVPAQGAFKATTEDTPLFVLASYNWRRSATPALKMQLS